MSGDYEGEDKQAKGTWRRGKDLHWKVVKVFGSNQEWLASQMKNELGGGKI